MRYDVHFGHKDFILYLAYKPDVIKARFLNYDEYVSDVFVLANGRPGITFHIVSVGVDDVVQDIVGVSKSDWITGRFFVFRRGIVDYIRPVEELVQEPLRRLIEKDEPITFRYDSSFLDMDTFKESQRLDDMYSRDETPWEVWKSPGARAASS
jgi:glucose-1-phosphate cytidylyltransferase